MAKDVSDTHEMVAYLSSTNPFTDNLELFILVSAVTADESVNANLASEMGADILLNTNGKRT